MKLFRPLTLLALLALACLSLSNRAYADHFTILSSLVFEGETYGVAIIEPDQLDFDQLNPAEVALAHRFLNEAQKWIIREYRTRYPKLPTEFFERMFQSNPLNDHSSATIIIFKGSDATKIQATMRVSRSLVLPSEILFGKTFDRPSLALGLYTSGENLWEGKPLSSNLRLIGTTYELKNFVVSAGAEEDFVPLLFYLAEKGGLTDSALMLPFPVYPANYVFTCNKRMLNYYERVGFKLLKDEPLSEDNYLMGVTREEFLSRVLEFYKRRSGYALTAKGKWNHDIYSRLLLRNDIHSLLNNFSLASDCETLFIAKTNRSQPPMIIKRTSRFRR